MFLFLTPFQGILLDFQNNLFSENNNFCILAYSFIVRTALIPKSYLWRSSVQVTVYHQQPRIQKVFSSPVISLDRLGILLNLPSLSFLMCKLRVIISTSPLSLYDNLCFLRDLT